jgi:polar amino acid transport system substrate-binding protein
MSRQGHRSVPRFSRAIGVGVIVLVALTAGCFAHEPDDGALGRVRERGVIRIGYAVEAPYAFVDGGRVVGESPDVAARVVAAMAIARTVWVQTTFDRLIPELLDGRFDVIAAGMFITDERQRRIAFSHPTFLVRQALLVKRGNPQSLHAYGDIARCDTCRTAVVASAFERELLELAGVSRERVVDVPDSQTGRAAVESGLVDALALSSITINWLASRDSLGRTEVARPFTQPTRGHTGGVSAGAFAFRLSDPSLRDAWNASLASFVGTSEHLRLIAPYGFTADELPPRVEGLQP